MGCWGATRECFRSCGKGPKSEHYDAWLARERLRQLNAQTDRNDKLQRQIAQMEMVVTQTQDILASYRDLDQMEADRTDMTRQSSVQMATRPAKSLTRVTFTPADPEPISRMTSQASADSKSDLRARIQAGARQMQAQVQPPPTRAPMQSVTSANLDADDWQVASVAKERSKTYQARTDRRRVPSPATDATRSERQTTMDSLRQPLPQMPAREFVFTPPAPIGTATKPPSSTSPFAAKGAGAAAFASTHGYPAPQPASTPAKP